jgi:hypothetical protein
MVRREEMLLLPRDFAHKVLFPVRVSGRVIIAQQFTAGIRHKGSESVERTADYKGPIRCTFFNRPLHGLPPVTADPSDNRGPHAGSPSGVAIAGLFSVVRLRTGRKTFCAKPFQDHTQRKVGIDVFD